ncbi:hypothetical protein LCGC14_2444900, partial [marine sediment metagenome]
NTEQPIHGGLVTYLFVASLTTYQILVVANPAVAR